MTLAERIRAAARKITDAAEYDQLDTEATRELFAIADELEAARTPVTCPESGGPCYWCPRADDQRDRCRSRGTHLQDGGQAPPAPCSRCKGCKQIDDGDEGIAWTHWLALPPGSDLAVRLGVVKPIPCPACCGPSRTS